MNTMKHDKYSCASMVNVSVTDNVMYIVYIQLQCHVFVHLLLRNAMLLSNIDYENCVNELSREEGNDCFMKDRNTFVDEVWQMHGFITHSTLSTLRVTLILMNL